MQQHTTYIAPRLRYRGELYYLHVPAGEDGLQASGVSEGCRNNSSLTFSNYKARFVQCDCAGKFHNGDMQVHNETRYLLRLLSFLRWLAYLQCFGLKVGANPVFIFKRTFGYSYVKLVTGQ